MWSGTVNESSESEEQEMNVQLTAANVGDATMDLVQARIIHTLSIYPKLNMSMLQVGIGTGFPPAIWHPALEGLISQGRVVRSTFTTTNPVSKRDQTYTIVELAVATT